MKLPLYQKLAKSTILNFQHNLEFCPSVYYSFTWWPFFIAFCDLSMAKQPNSTSTLLAKSTWMFWFNGAKKCRGNANLKDDQKCLTLYLQILQNKKLTYTQTHQKVFKKIVNKSFILLQLTNFGFWHFFINFCRNKYCPVWQLWVIPSFFKKTC